MNGNNTNNQRNDVKTDLVDIDFSHNREMDLIRQNEERERERRRRIAAQIRRREIIRQKKIDRMKRMVLAWSVLAFGVIIVIAIILGIISLFTNKDDKNDKGPVNAVPVEQTQLVDSFLQYENPVYSNGENDNTYQKINEYLSQYDYSQDACFAYNSLLKYYAKTFASSGLDVRENVKKAVRDCAMYSNGYVWSQEKSMKFEKTNSYLYDTNASFVSAVAEICRWEASADFLNQLDVNQQANKDVSGGLTVGEKLDKAVEFFFDEDDINGGGIRYNKEDNLVYVLTKENDGTSTGHPSNIFYNYRFGYLDLYNNIMFFEAMNDAAFIYSLSGNEVSAQKYLDIAKKNKAAINKTFFSDTRYIGCIDENKNSYDYGFAALNLYAVSSGVADENKANKVLSWVNGESKVNTDTVDSANIYKTKATPLFSTVEANESWWLNTADAQNVDNTFGNYWQNGGESYLAGAFGLLAAKEKDTPSLLNEYTSQLVSGALDDAETVLGEPEIFRLYGLDTLQKQKFGISVDGTTLCLKPVDLGEAVLGIKNIAFGGNDYGFLFDNGEVYITALYERAVKLKISGFEKGQKLNVVTVKDGIAELTEAIIADENGCVSLSKLFGKNTYLKIEKAKQNKK